VGSSAGAGVSVDTGSSVAGRVAVGVAISGVGVLPGSQEAKVMVVISNSVNVVSFFIATSLSLGCH
jgi:hypothetical protein